MGLLDWLQSDPEKQAALRQGLISAGAAMMAGGRQDFGAALGQGVGAGVKTYAQTFDEARKKALAMAPYKAAMTPAKPAIPARFNVGGQSLPQLGQAQDVAQNMYNLPVANPYAQPQQPMAMKPEEPAYDMPASLMPQGMGIEDMSGGQPGQIEEVAAQPGTPESFDVDKYFQAGLANPESDVFKESIKYFASKQLEAQKAKNPTEQFGKIMPHAYSPESLAKYKQTGNYADLKPIGGQGDFGKVNPGQFTPESLARYAETGMYGDLVPFRSPVQIDQGNVKTLYDPGSRTNTSYGVAPKPDEMPAFKAAQSAAVETAKNSVEAGKNLPKTQASASTARALVQGILDHPGFESSVGATLRPGFKYIPGTKESDFNSRVGQLQGAAFLEAFNTLKGGGQITEVEGNKATVAINRMSTTTSEKEFRAAAKDFLDVVDRAEQNAKRATAQKPKSGVMSPEEILNVELQNALDAGDTQEAEIIRREMRSRKFRETASPKNLPQKTQAKSAFDLPPNAKQYEGKTMTDTKTGKRFMSTGGQWRAVQ